MTANIVLVVIPCLNEEPNLERLVTQLVLSNPTLPLRIVIADGGSTDDSIQIAELLTAKYPNVFYMNNPKRWQGSGINLAVSTYGNDAEFLIRTDAHADYPDDYCQKLIEEAKAKQAVSVVVSLDTKGTSKFQRAVAMAQNSKLGNGGSAHRMAPYEGRWVDHGHHALMSIKVFQHIGGYDESFSHNEDAELDTRLGKAGYKIWLTGKTRKTYYPRSSPAALFKQYFNYGRWRARTMLKHRTLPKLRQLLPAAIAPIVLLAPLWGMAKTMLLIWAFICISYGFWLGTAIAGLAAMIMHLGWSLGFWYGLIKELMKRIK